MSGEPGHRGILQTMFLVGAVWAVGLAAMIVAAAILVRVTQPDSGPVEPNDKVQVDIPEKTPVTTPEQGLVTTSQWWPPGVCTNIEDSQGIEELTVVDCGAPHTAEVIGLIGAAENKEAACESVAEHMGITTAAIGDIKHSIAASQLGDTITCVLITETVTGSVVKTGAVDLKAVH